MLGLGAFITAALATATPKITLDPLMIDLHNNVEATLAAIAVPGVEIEYVSYFKCGAVNAAYVPVLRSIYICEELAHEMPGFQRFAVAHEYGHAVIHQLDLPYTGSEEAAADEFAEFALTATGHTTDIADAAAFYSMSGEEEDPTDPHPSDARREYTFECVVNGLGEDPTEECHAYAFRVYRTWVRLLTPAMETNDREVGK